MLAPVSRDVDAATEPDAVKGLHVLQQLDQAAGATGAADQTVVQADRQQLRRSGDAFGVQEIESVAHVVEELLTGGEAGIFVEAVVVGFVRIRNDQMRSMRGGDPVWQLVGERIAIIKKAALLSDQPSRIGTRDAPSSSRAGGCR